MPLPFFVVLKQLSGKKLQKMYFVFKTLYSFYVFYKSLIEGLGRVKTDQADFTDWMYFLKSNLTEESCSNTGALSAVT